MILYHGSTDLVDKPEIRVAEVFLDFGVGFYTVKKLKTEVLHDQWTLHTDKILDYLTFIEAKEIR